DQPRRKAKVRMFTLIAEDDPVCCAVLEDTLTGWGHEVLITHDGDAAWDALRGARAPQIAVLDWQMPGLSGPDICRRVQEEHLNPRPYLILLSARGLKTDLVAGLRSGADDYLSKPF